MNSYLRGMVIVALALATFSSAAGCCGGHGNPHQNEASNSAQESSTATEHHDHDHHQDDNGRGAAQTFAENPAHGQPGHVHSDQEGAHDHHDHDGHDHDHAHGNSHSESVSEDSRIQSVSDYMIVFAAGLSVPLVSLLGNLACRHFKRSVTQFLPILVSFGAGTMLASAVVHFIPEAVIDTNLGADAHQGAFLRIGLPILIGMLVSIILEFVIHSIGGHHHDHDDLGFADVEAAKAKNTSEMQAMAWNMLIADGIHNAIDGVVIGTTFGKGMWEGCIATLLIILHELPQEIAELCVLLHAGWPMRKAIIRNCLSTLTILIGIAIGLALSKEFEVVQTYCLAFIAGEFLYVSLGQLMPSLARTVMTRRQTMYSHLAFVTGVMFICLLTYNLPHAHGHSHAGGHDHGHGHSH